MISFLNESNEEPFRIFKSTYERALQLNQNNIQAISISSYCLKTKYVDSRFVNLKFIDGDKFIFFTNYNSPKAKQFQGHEQISALIFWSSINTQIRLKAIIEKTSKEYNDAYFSSRDDKKNALAISSKQSNKIDSFEIIKDNFYSTLESQNTRACPEYWGGYSFSPYEIEFWEGDKYRLNKRNFYQKDQDKWNHFILQP